MTLACSSEDNNSIKLWDVGTGELKSTLTGNSKTCNCIAFSPDGKTLAGGCNNDSLSCAAILARYGMDVTVVESHSIPGGAAHAFERNGYKFESRPSLYSDLSYTPSPNPLRQVLDAIEEDLPCINYDTWGCYLPEGYFDAQVGANQFCEVLHKLQAEQAVT